MNLEISEIAHPNSTARAEFDALVGIDAQKRALLEELHLLLKPDDLAKWQREFHPKAGDLISRFSARCPMILLSGDVGCGKSMLARSVATPLAECLDTRVKVFESPTDLRGGGHVGELSQRLTELFRKARQQTEKGYGLLVIDESDDVAASREQDQAHHEDRAGVNVLIKQINMLTQANTRMAVMLITNRLPALDPAVVRRAALHVQFTRPTSKDREELIASVFPNLTPKEVHEVSGLCERDGVPFSSSDIADRLFGTSIRRAWSEKRAMDANIIREVARELEPSPRFE